MKFFIFLAFLFTLKTFAKNQIVVAVIDTGIDLSHDCLKNSLQINTNEIPNNGIDDDKNGFIDDVYGWNFIDNNNDLSDSNGHGTHVSGLITSTCFINKNLKNSSADIKILPIKYYDSKKTPSEIFDASLKAIDYAIRMKVDIINFSGGGYQPYRLEKNLIQKAQEKNIIFIASAGNDKSNNDVLPFYPASYPLNNIISVAAVDESLKLPKFSNFGKKSVMVAAHGTNIISTLPYNKFGRMSGTSQATALVSNKVALELLRVKKISIIQKNVNLLKILKPISQVSKQLDLYTKTSLLVN